MKEFFTSSTSPSNRVVGAGPGSTGDLASEGEVCSDSKGEVGLVDMAFVLALRATVLSVYSQINSYQ